MVRLGHQETGIAERIGAHRCQAVRSRPVNALKFVHVPKRVVDELDRPRTIAGARMAAIWAVDQEYCQSVGEDDQYWRKAWLQEGKDACTPHELHFADGESIFLALTVHPADIVDRSSIKMVRETATRRPLPRM